MYKAKRDITLQFVNKMSSNDLILTEENIKLSTPEISIIDTSHEAGEAAYYCTLKFTCKNSIIKAKEIYLPSKEKVDSNCNLEGEVKYQGSDFEECPLPILGSMNLDLLYSYFPEAEDFFA